MSELNDANTRAAVSQGRTRIEGVLQEFSRPQATWSDLKPETALQFLESVKIDLATLSMVVEQELQERYSVETQPQEFAHEADQEAG